MKRNNASRLGDLESQGATPDDSSPAAAIAASDAPGLSDLSFVVGVDTVSLPSQGFLYPEGHPCHGVSTIELKHMTAKEEDILTNTSFIKNGTALDKMLNSLLVDQSIDLDSLVVGDKNALLLAARISAYGEEYSAKVTCQSCMANQTYTFDLEEIEPGGLNELNLTLDGAELTPNKTILIRTPRSGLLFELRPMIGADEKELESRAKKYKKLKIPAHVGLSDHFANLTVSINGERDPSKMKQVIENLPAYDFRHLRKVYQRCMPNSNLLSDFTCSECGAEEVISVPLNATFFWPDVGV